MKTAGRSCKKAAGPENGQASGKREAVLLILDGKAEESNGQQHRTAPDRRASARKINIDEGKNIHRKAGCETERKFQKQQANQV